MESVFSRCTWRDAGGPAEVSLHRGRGRKDETDKLTLPHSRDCTQVQGQVMAAQSPPQPPRFCGYGGAWDEEQWGRWYPKLSVLVP